MEEGSPEALRKAGKAEAERGGVERVGSSGDQVRGPRPQDPRFHESLPLLVSVTALERELGDLWSCGWLSHVVKLRVVGLTCFPSIRVIPCQVPSVCRILVVHRVATALTQLRVPQHCKVAGTSMVGIVSRSCL